MERHFDEELKALKGRLLQMASLAEESIAKSIKALVERDKKLAEDVIKSDEAINLLEIEVDELSLKLLALHRIPFASPADPIQHARSAFYTDSYKEFTLPQASLRYQNILNTFLGNAWDEKKILILDPRVKEYEGYFN